MLTQKEKEEWQNAGMDFEHFRKYDKNGKLVGGEDRHTPK